MKTIAIFTFEMAKSRAWDPDSIHQGIGGSEEAVIYMSRQLVNMGFRVIVFATVPPESPYALENSNPRFIDIASLSSDARNQMVEKWALQPLDVAISWRLPSIGAGLRRVAKKIFFWPHDLSEESLSEEEVGFFDDVLWLSEFQRQQWISQTPSFEKFRHIFGNGINPEQFAPIAPRKNPYSCIYGSSYGRGLGPLLDCWPDVKQKYPLATLDIYFGYEANLGIVSAAQEKILDRKIKQLKGVKEHGRVGHEELTRAYEQASFWVYPCSCSETFCITALRAQFAGAIPVVIQRAALCETVRHGFCCTAPEEYLSLLLKALGFAEEISEQKRSEMRKFIIKEYTWKIIAN